MESREFDLNIERVLDGWRISHAVRELIANALDEAALTGTPDVVIEKAGSDWVIRDFGRGLRYEHLTQNESDEKRAHQDKVIGRFGVGLKDAFAVLNRHRIRVAIRSCHNDLGLVDRAKAGFDDVVTLHALVSPPSDSAFKGTEVRLAGLSDEDVREAKGYFLRFSGDRLLEATRYGQIFDRGSGRPARVYVNGLMVAEEENFLFSYNITSLIAPMKKALNRERTNVGRSAYSDRVKAMLLLAESEAVAGALTKDLAYFAEGTEHDETKWVDVQVRACQILNVKGNVVFVTAGDLAANRDMVDLAERDGKTIVTVPTTTATNLGQTSDLKGAPIATLVEFGRQWNESFQFQFIDPEALSDAERRVFDLTPTIARIAGGIPPAVRAVRVSETMRQVLGDGGDASGLWDPVQATIIIHRPQLRSIAAYAGILLHEIVHAKTGLGDVSREFELALTDLIGKLGEQLVLHPPEQDGAA